ncbi:MAG: YbaB/EbfC family nucleoid-associated protein [Clostridia bacterium]|nr:YbaB/EbfC family nucleoid-associated protein [Clostridia bacterium]MBR2734656.1 YbaB/EbfC family nucleoid-associated protein [Clostridia bacterium]MDO4200072.1 YbaB/EbfC family nucleoid-associated protein [Clostridia bacterium]
MKVRLPGQGMGGMNIQKLAQQAQQAQKEVEKVSAELDEKEYTATAGGEAVKVTIIGKPEVKKIEVNSELVDVAEDMDLLCDMIVAATNEAIKKATNEKDTALNSITGGMNLQGLF